MLLSLQPFEQIRAIGEACMMTGDHEGKDFAEGPV
jgi:hypothetical protein